jgi:hypothetical protein
MVMSLENLCENPPQGSVNEIIEKKIKLSRQRTLKAEKEN